MIECKICKKQNRDQAKFCLSCGKELTTLGSDIRQDNEEKYYTEHQQEIIKKIQSKIRTHLDELNKSKQANIPCRNKIFLITGPSGSGKKTITRCISLYAKKIKAFERTAEKNICDITEENVTQICNMNNSLVVINDCHRADVEFIDQLVKLINDGENKSIYILTALKDDFELLIKQRNDIKQHVFFLPSLIDNTPEEVSKIAMILLEKEGYVISDSNKDEINKKLLRKTKEIISENCTGHANAHISKDIVEAIKDECTKNHAGNYTIEEKDIVTRQILTIEDVNDSLKTIVGQKRLKETLKTTLNNIERNRDQKKKPGLNFIFQGPPGIGKTSVARYLADFFFANGYFATNKIVEVSRADLIAGYIGQTALTTIGILKKSLGHVLLIDEAYMLVPKSPSSNDYGKECIETLMKFMDDHRGELAIVLTGYPKPMKDFLDTNPGLTSRFTDIITFEEYEKKDLDQFLLEVFPSQEKCKFTEEAKVSAMAATEWIHDNKTDNFANARTIRTLYERITGELANRLVNNRSADRFLITDEDVRRGFAKFKEADRGTI